jgi:hypothetical protein
MHSIVTYFEHFSRVSGKVAADYFRSLPNFFKFFLPSVLSGSGGDKAK